MQFFILLSQWASLVKYKDSVDRLGRILDEMHGRDGDRMKRQEFYTKKEIMWSRLRTFDRAIELFKDKRNFVDDSNFDEEFRSVKQFDPKRKRNLTLGNFKDFHKRGTPTSTKLGIFLVFQ